MSAFGWLFKSGGEIGQAGLESIFPLSLSLEDFKFADIVTTYTKILTDCAERTHGLSEDQYATLWDNCLQSESNFGLISLLACAMSDKSKLFIVYDEPTNVLRKATTKEQEQIESDYKKQGKSPVGVFVSFQKYRRTDMLTIYSIMEHCILASLHKSMNLSKAIQVKMNDMRTGVSLQDSSITVNQAKSIADALRNGKDVLMDAKDSISTATPDTSSTEKAIGFLNGKRAFILSLPISYISGLQTAGIGSTGEADNRAVEIGLRQYFASILQPVLQALFDISVSFKSNDFRDMGSSLEALKTFDLVSEQYMSLESKRAVIARIFDLDAAEEEKNLEEADAEAAANPPEPVVNPPVQPQQGQGK